MLVDAHVGSTRARQRCSRGRDQVNPKPLDHSGFATPVKGANAVWDRPGD